MSDEEVPMDVSVLRLVSARTGLALPRAAQLLSLGGGSVDEAMDIFRANPRLFSGEHTAIFQTHAVGAVGASFVPWCCCPRVHAWL